MQMAIDVGGFSPGEADQLRQAMGSKRSQERMERLHQRFADGAAERGVGPEVTEQIWLKLAAFASYGFPESHSVSFAYLVYASSWIKRYYPAAFFVSAALPFAAYLLREEGDVAPSWAALVSPPWAAGRIVSKAADWTPLVVFACLAAAGTAALLARKRPDTNHA